MLTAVVALLLAIGGTALPATGPPEPDPASGSGPDVTMTVVNDGHAVSLLDATHPGWAHTDRKSVV